MKKAPKIILRRSKIHGRGVFAIARIKEGEEICEYQGKLVTHEEADDRYGGEDDGHTFLFILNKQWVVDGNVGGNIARWINHGCAPNSEAVPVTAPGRDRRKDKIVITAVRDIAKGEELTYDYEIEVDHRITKAERALWACRCGSPKCLGTMLTFKGRM